jgi:hypothetical protein
VPSSCGHRHRHRGLVRPAPEQAIDCAIPRTIVALSQPSEHMKPKRSTARPNSSINRTCPGKTGDAGYLKRYAA